MNGKLSALVTPLIISAMRMACSSLSITHGPATRKRSPDPMRTSPTWKEEINEPFHRRARGDRRDKPGKTTLAIAFLGACSGDLGGKTSVYLRATFSGR